MYSWHPQNYCTLMYTKLLYTIYCISSASILQMKLRFREVKSPRSHIWEWDSNSALPDSKVIVTTLQLRPCMEDGAGDQCKYLPWRRKREREKGAGSHFTDGQTKAWGRQLACSKSKSKLVTSLETTLSLPSLVSQ